jgi:hypothetical protein
MSKMLKENKSLPVESIINNTLNCVKVYDLIKKDKFINNCMKGLRQCWH